MKKRKKRRSKTEGGDNLPFDDEMGKNQKAIKVLQRLFDAGYGTEKEIVNMAMDEMLALPGVNVADLCIISELQKSIKANKVISYLSGKKEVKEETKGAARGNAPDAFIIGFPPNPCQESWREREGAEGFSRAGDSALPGVRRQKQPAGDISGGLSVRKAGSQGAGGVSADCRQAQHRRGLLHGLPGRLCHFRCGLCHGADRSPESTGCDSQLTFSINPLFRGPSSGTSRFPSLS